MTSDCPRCSAALSSPRALEAHLVNVHLMGAAQAQRESRARETDGRLGTVKRDRPPPQLTQADADAHGVGRLKPPTDQGVDDARKPPDHACPRCGAAVACDWRAVATMEQQAHRLKILAGMWKARLNGASIGRPRRNTFDVETARHLVAGGLTYQAVAEALGASSPSAVKSALTRGRAKA